MALKHPDAAFHKAMADHAAFDDPWDKDSLVDRLLDEGDPLEAAIVQMGLQEMGRAEFFIDRDVSRMATRMAIRLHPVVTMYNRHEIKPEEVFTVTGLIDDNIFPADPMAAGAHCITEMLNKILKDYRLVKRR